MSKLRNDINDDEIRIISSAGGKRQTAGDSGNPRRKKSQVGLIIVGLMLFGLVIWGLSAFWIHEVNPDDELQFNIENAVQSQNEPGTEVPPRTAIAAKTDTVAPQPAYVEVVDTVVGGEPLTLLIPRNATATLQVGAEALRDSGTVLIAQAADIRRDNGGIVGAYVLKGELLSRGQSKSGFCAIINGKIVLGVADSTPYLEQAIESEGYFFRQYPLVVGGQAVENRLKPSSLRKALAELNGEIMVILSHRKMTLNRFAGTLVDLGVTNAIYLVGSTAFGYAVDAQGERIEFGKPQPTPPRNTNYILWH